MCTGHCDSTSTLLSRLNRRVAELTERFIRALTFATERHSGQKRKGTEVPYMSHLLGTCALVLEAGGDEDEAIAALLHDALEDQAATYEEIADRFGERVAVIVRECSDSEEEPKPPWRERKQAYVDNLVHHSRSAVLVSNADKLHNLRTIVADYRMEGERLWGRFNSDSDPVWYYTALAGVFAAVDAPLADELLVTLDELKRLQRSPTSHVRFMVRRALDGSTRALLRIVDGQAEQWTTDGWVLAGLEWTGIGGAADYDDIGVREAAMILIEFGADRINPFLGLERNPQFDR